MDSRSKKYIILISKILAGYLGILLLFSVGFQVYRYWDESRQAISNIENTHTPPEVTETEAEPEPVLPNTYNITVPYAGQAPFSNWTIHEESCEEAAIYMYRAYLEGSAYANGRIPEAEADQIFKAMKTWQVINYGKEPDLTMTALGDFVKSYYGYTPTVKKNITENDIITAISAGHPVIVPVMTHSLENTMYGTETTYHVILIKGYNETGVFTNDAGVGNGPNHHYTWEILWKAIDAQRAEMKVGREMLYLTK